MSCPFVVDYQSKARPQTGANSASIHYGPQQLKNIRRQVEREIGRRRPKSEPARRTFITQADQDSAYEMSDAAMIHRSLTYTTFSARLEVSRRYGSSSSHRRVASTSTLPVNATSSSKSVTIFPGFQSKLIQREEPTICPVYAK